MGMSMAGAGMAGAGAMTSGMGATLGGIGDIISALNYDRPSLKEPGGQEARLRSLTNAQMIGGGQQMLAGNALYNQMVPMLLGQLPGMSIKQTGGTAGEGGSGAGPGGASYNDALTRYNAALGRQQQLKALQAQVKGMQKGAEKKATRQQIKSLKRAKKGDQKIPALERQMYQAGTAPPQITVAPSGTDTAPLGGQGSGGSPSLQSSLAEIMGFLQSGKDNGGSAPDFEGRYRTGFDQARPVSDF